MNDEQQEQSALFDLTGKEFNPLFADESTPVFIANNPLYWKAHRLQIMLDRLEKQMQSNPAQFSSSSYLKVLNDLTVLMGEINGKSGVAPVLESGDVVESIPEPSGSPTLRAGESNGVDIGISADNPFARQRVSAA